ncbi:MAG: ASCH domain-containing protein [Minisyncoccia bacterium]|jgi:ASC-1-like (ASCH) protein
MNPPAVIKFAPELIPLIKNGSKTLTYRLGNKYDFISVGDTVILAENDGKNVATATIIEKSRMTFGKLPLNRVGHEVYRSEEEKTKTFEKYYSRQIHSQDEFIVLGFKIL